MRKTSNKCTEIPVNIVGGSKFNKYPKVSAERTWNLFESDGWLVNFPGYKKILEFETEGEGRGVYVSFNGNIMVAVVGASVYSITSGFAPVRIGFLATSTGDVFFDENLNAQICIVDGLNAYIYNYTYGSVLFQQTLDASLTPSYVIYHNTYFLFGNSKNSEWFIYQSSSATTIEYVFRQQIQTKPDTPIAVKRIPGQANNVMVFGRTVCEVWTQLQSPEVYRKNTSVSVDYGCISNATIAADLDYLCWIGVNENNTPSIMVFNGGQMTRISTDGIDNLLDNLNFPSRSTAMMYNVDGHTMYHVTFYDPSDNLSIIYDFKTQKFFDITDHELNFHPARQAVYFNLELYFINISNGSIYQMSTNFTTMDENIGDNTQLWQLPYVYTIPRVRICETVRAANTAMFRANSITFPIDMGNDNIAPIQDCIVSMVTEDNIPIISENYIQMVPEGGGSENCESVPYMGRVDLAISYNGGETWSGNVPRYLNPVGYRRNIFRWENMGEYNEFTPKFYFWTLGRIVCYNAILETF